MPPSEHSCLLKLLLFGRDGARLWQAGRPITCSSSAGLTAARPLSVQVTAVCERQLDVFFHVGCLLSPQIGLFGMKITLDYSLLCKVFY